LAENGASRVSDVCCVTKSTHNSCSDKERAYDQLVPYALSAAGTPLAPLNSCYVIAMTLQTMILLEK